MMVLRVEVWVLIFAVHLAWIGNVDISTAEADSEKGIHADS